MSKKLKIILIIMLCTLAILTLSNMEQAPNEPQFANLHVESVDDEIGRYLFDNRFLPEIINDTSTVINLIKFEYKSFNQVALIVKFELNYPDKPIFSVDEKWKYDFPSIVEQKKLLPFLSIFIPEDPNPKIESIDIRSKLTNVTLKDDASNPIEVTREVNKILYLPESFNKFFTAPKKDQNYEFFAGHNVLLSIPPQKGVYTLEFCIDYYTQQRFENPIINTIPLLFLSNSVEIKKYEVISPFNHKINVPLHKHQTSKNAINVIKREQLREGDIGLTSDKSDLALLGITTLGNEIYAGEIVKNLMPNDLKYNGTLLQMNKHVLTLKEGLNVSIKASDSPVPISIYDLLKKNESVLVPPVIEYFLMNNKDEDVDLKIKTEVIGLTEPEIKNIRINKHGFIKHKFIPNFKNEKIANINHPAEFTVYSAIMNANTNALLFEETNTVKILPIDTMLWNVLDISTGSTQFFYNYIINWAKPFKSEKLDNVLSSALDKVHGNNFFGYDEGAFQMAFKNKIFESRNEFTRQIVKSIYEALSENEPRYSNETLDFGRSSNQDGQRVKYPKDTLEQGRGNCIDSTLMFATILEQIGINPVIVIIPNHAFLGWETWDNSNEYEYLETTLLGYDDFESAFLKGTENFDTTRPEEKKQIIFKRLRAEGIYSNEFSEQSFEK